MTLYHITKRQVSYHSTLLQKNIQRSMNAAIFMMKTSSLHITINRGQRRQQQEAYTMRNRDTISLKTVRGMFGNVASDMKAREENLMITREYDSTYTRVDDSMLRKAQQLFAVISDSIFFE